MPVGDNLLWCKTGSGFSVHEPSSSEPCSPHVYECGACLQSNRKVKIASGIIDGNRWIAQALRRILHGADDTVGYERSSALGRRPPRYWHIRIGASVGGVDEVEKD